MLKKKYNGMDLKMVALVTMFLDHVGAVLIETTYLSGSLGFQMLNVTLRLIGRLAFPIYAFLLVEGFLHTRDWKNYTGRMLALAVISEIPFDLAAYGELNWGHQNVFFTLLLGLLMMKGLEKYEFQSRGETYLVIGAGCVSAWWMNVDYSYVGLLLIAVLYLLRADHKKRCLFGGILFAFEVTSIFSFVMMYRYTGERGEQKMPKAFFYGFYPAHLLVLWLIRTLFIL